MNIKISKLTLLIILISQFAAGSSYGQCASQSNIITFNYGGKSYEIVKELKTWEQASQCAVERGGYLVHLDSLPEQVAVFNALSTSGISATYQPVADGGGTSYIWIGATDKNSEGTWLWDGNNDNTGTNFWNGQGAAGANNGSAIGVAYVNWGGKSTGTINEPDDYASNQDAAGIALSGWPSGTTLLGISGEWNDISLSNTIYYIIEYNYLLGVKVQINLKNQLSINTNPTKNILKLSTENEVKSITIYNMNGSLVYQSNKSFKGEYSVNVESFKPGIYILLINNNGQNYHSLRFIKE
jgi:hypothetical protein